MKKNSCLVNTARGPIVSEDALFDAIDNKRLLRHLMFLGRTISW